MAILIGMRILKIGTIERKCRKMRLIDADDAINIMTNRLFEMLKTHIPCVTATENQTCLETCYKIAKYEIDNIPTAYDIEKVVAELEEDKHDNPMVTDNYILRKNAIDIVRKGGVE